MPDHESTDLLQATGKHEANGRAHGSKNIKVLSIPELSQEGFVTMVSAQGKIKKTSISEFSRP
ncbi:MAG: hypothetical protein M1511_14380, partial [Deltaproteobacteria bacterium]|nr:hypothetical protein [Deltaproteobacteria bacterium]